MTKNFNYKYLAFFQINFENLILELNTQYLCFGDNCLILDV